MTIALPKQVQRQLDEIAEHEAALASTDPPAAVDPPAPEPPQPPASEAPPEPKAGENWEQKYKTLQGMFDAERNRAANANKTLMDQVASLTLSINELKAAKAAEPPKSSITDKDIDAFGGDLVDLVKRAAADTVAAERAAWNTERAALTNELAALKGQAQSASQTSAQIMRDRYNASLAERHPDFLDVNATDDFKAYCREVDPMWGEPRQAALGRAWDAYNVDATAQFFDAYKQARGMRAPTPARNPQRELEAQVQPRSRKATSMPGEDGSTKIWSTSEIDKFYRDVGRGVYRGKDAEMATIENQIDLAVAQGRVK